MNHAATALLDTNTLAGWDPRRYRVIETGMTAEAFEAGHIPGAVFLPFTALTTSGFRLREDSAQFGRLLSQAGITPEMAAVCSFSGAPAAAGWAAWLFWILTGFGHAPTFLLDGGTPKWLAEGRPAAHGKPQPEPTRYPAPPPFAEGHRARRERVEALLAAPAAAAALPLLDARSAEEWDAGHIPGARFLPHTALRRADGTYLPPEELRALMAELTPDREVIAYCAVGIRASTPWFVLRYLLGFPEVRNYDASWTEWSRTGEGKR